MSVNHFCTYFDHNYIPRALVMLESLHRHAPCAVVHVLCLTQACLEAMRRLALPFIRLYALDELERSDPELLAVKGTRSMVEYYFTLTPCFPAFLFARVNIDALTYLDADMMFFSSPEPLFLEAEKAAVIITPHRFSPAIGPSRAQLERYGLFNVSWITFTDSGRDCLDWYRAVCIEWCYDRVEGNRFADQKYLDSFQERFEGVHVMRHKGGGVAPWNLAGSTISVADGQTLVDGYPLIFFHAQGFQHIWGPFFSSGGATYRFRPNDAQRKFIFRPYAQAYRSSEKTALALGVCAQKAGPRLHERRSFSKNLRWIRDEFKEGSLIV